MKKDFGTITWPRSEYEMVPIIDVAWPTLNQLSLNFEWEEEGHTDMYTVRLRSSDGISYTGPIDKGKNSVGICSLEMFSNKRLWFLYGAWTSGGEKLLCTVRLEKTEIAGPKING